jgi:hypothetical protein
MENSKITDEENVKCLKSTRDNNSMKVSENRADRKSENKTETSSFHSGKSVGYEVTSSSSSTSSIPSTSPPVCNTSNLDLNTSKSVFEFAPTNSENENKIINENKNMKI